MGHSFYILALGNALEWRHEHGLITGYSLNLVIVDTSGKDSLWTQIVHSTQWYYVVTGNSQTTLMVPQRYHTLSFDWHHVNIF